MSEFDVLPTPAGGDTPAPAAAPTPAAPPVAATPATPSAPTTGAPEDRSTWVPPYRIRETREAAVREAQAQWATREAQIRKEADQYKTQLHALVGVQPPQNPEIEAVRGQFGQLYPGLAKMEAQADRIVALLDRAGDLETQNNHYWQSYGRQTMDRLFSHAQESMGAPLTEEGKRQLHAAFVGYIQQSPELQQRYSNDPSLVQDFWKQFTSSFIDPVRRTAAAGVVNRAATPGLPQDSPSGAPRAAGAPQMNSLDDRVNAAWATYEQTKR